MAVLGTRQATRQQRPHSLINTTEALTLLSWSEGRKVSQSRMRRIAKEHHIVACMANSRSSLWRIEDIERLADIRRTA